MVRPFTPYLLRRAPTQISFLPCIAKDKAVSTPTSSSPFSIAEVRDMLGKEGGRRFSYETTVRLFSFTLVRLLIKARHT
ncbi:hypothetical protein KEJ49_06385 [Candidatus Bathyarchaeota archaeon]|nr:hypothetical protein [Candidatus Bathyarchaeota archaeon]